MQYTTIVKICKKELYEPLKIPEVWFWKSGQLRVFALHDEKYQEVSQSLLLPDLDLALLLKYVGHPDQVDAVQEFLTEIRQGKENS